MGPLASARRRGDVEARVRSGVAEGARVVAGARRPASPVRGYFYEPTVLTDVTPEYGDRAGGDLRPRRHPNQV